MGFGQGLSGIKAASQNLDVIGNNISNSQTVGFKSGSVNFADVYAGSRVGLGVQVAEISQRFTTGALSATGKQFDVAIDGDKGLFRLVEPNGSVVYSRNGQFGTDKDFNIVNAQGQKLTGYQATSDGRITGELGPIKLPVGNIAPEASSEAVVKANFDSREPVKTAPAAADLGEVIKPENHNHSLPMTVYDSLGNSHQVTQYYLRTSATDTESTWSVYYQFDDREPTQGPELVFNQAGILQSPTEPYAYSVTGIGGVAVPPATEADAPANDLAIEFDYAGSTQFGGNFSSKFSQNGYSTGEYTSMSIANNGDLIANYTNGETKMVGAIALADFNNLNGLQPVGGNAWIETSASGQPVIGRPGLNGLASLKGQAVEESNVEMSEELVNMIVAQRTYQANAQTIKTQDQILQTLITLR